MANPDDNALLREFADQRSETAFAELVQRHLNLVFSVAMRYAGNPADAQDIAQAVFLILAKKAGNLRQRTTLTGWLYETTRLTAGQLCRARRRQQIRDQEAYMQSTLDQAGSNEIWRQIAPHLEDAMSRLNERDRALLALRFYENKTGTEAARLLGIEAEAAHKRTTRALEKLRKIFAKHGVTSTSAAIGESIAANSIQAAPTILAKSITAMAVPKSATASTSTLTLIKGTLKIMAWSKTQTVIVAGVVVLLAAGTAAVTVKQIQKAHNPDSAWRYPNIDSPVVDKLPPGSKCFADYFPGRRQLSGRKQFFEVRRNRAIGPHSDFCRLSLAASQNDFFGRCATG